MARGSCINVPAQIDPVREKYQQRGDCNEIGQIQEFKLIRRIVYIGTDIFKRGEISDSCNAFSDL